MNCQNAANQGRCQRYVEQYARPASGGRKLNLARLISVASETLKLWFERAQQRRNLGVLANHPEFLKDTAISRGEALHEAGKHFWTK